MEFPSENKENETRGCLSLNDKIYPVYDGHNTIGRNPDAIINIKNLNVSKHHAVITILDRNSHYLSDFKSSNGTILNNEKLTPLQLYKLNDGASIRFGDVFCTYKKLEGGKGVRKSLEESQECSEHFYGTATQEVAFVNAPDGINFNELPTQVFKDLSTHEMETQVHDFLHLNDESSNDSIDFVTMQKSTETQSFAMNEVEDPVEDTKKDCPATTSENIKDNIENQTSESCSSSQIRPVGVNSMKILDCEPDEDLTPRICPVKIAKKNVLESDSDTEEYVVSETSKSKYMISDDSETDIDDDDDDVEENKSVQNKSGVAESQKKEQDEYNSMDSFRLAVSECTFENKNEDAEKVKSTQKNHADHLYCQSFSQAPENCENNKMGTSEPNKIEETGAEREDLVAKNIEPTCSSFLEDNLPEEKKMEEDEETPTFDQPDKNLDVKNEDEVSKNDNIMSNDKNEDIDLYLPPTQTLDLLEFGNDSKKFDETQKSLESEDDIFLQPTQVLTNANVDKIANPSKTLSVPEEEGQCEFLAPTQALENLYGGKPIDEPSTSSVKQPNEMEEDLQTTQSLEILLDNDNIPTDPNKNQFAKISNMDKSLNLSHDNDDDIILPERIDEPSTSKKEDNIFVSINKFKTPSPLRNPKKKSLEQSPRIEDDDSFILQPTQALENLYGGKPVDEPSTSSVKQTNEMEEDLQTTQSLEILLDNDNIPSDPSKNQFEKIPNIDKSLILNNENDDDIILPERTDELSTSKKEDNIFVSINSFKTPSPLRNSKKKSPEQSPRIEDDDSFILQPTQALEVLHEDGTHFNKVEDQLHEIFASQSLLCTQQLVDVLNTTAEGDVIADSILEESTSSTKLFSSFRFQKSEPLTADSVTKILSEEIDENNDDENTEYRRQREVKTYSAKRGNRKQEILNRKDEDTENDKKEKQKVKEKPKQNRIEDDETERYGGSESKVEDDKELEGNTDKSKRRVDGEKREKEVKMQATSSKDVNQSENETAGPTIPPKDNEVEGKHRRSRRKQEFDVKVEAGNSECVQQDEKSLKSVKEKKMTTMNKSDTETMNSTSKSGKQEKIEHDVPGREKKDSDLQTNIKNWSKKSTRKTRNQQIDNQPEDPQTVDIFGIIARQTRGRTVDESQSSNDDKNETTKKTTSDSDEIGLRTRRKAGDESSSNKADNSENVRTRGRKKTDNEEKNAEVPKKDTQGKSEKEDSQTSNSSEKSGPKNQRKSTDESQSSSIVHDETMIKRTRRKTNSEETNLEVKQNSQNKTEKGDSQTSDISERSVRRIRGKAGGEVQSSSIDNSETTSKRGRKKIDAEEKDTPVTKKDAQSKSDKVNSQDSDISERSGLRTRGKAVDELESSNVGTSDAINKRGRKKVNKEEQNTESIKNTESNTEKVKSQASDISERSSRRLRGKAGDESGSSSVDNGQTAKRTRKNTDNEQDVKVVKDTSQTSDKSPGNRRTRNAVIEKEPSTFTESQSSSNDDETPGKRKTQNKHSTSDDKDNELQSNRRVSKRKKDQSDEPPETPVKKKMIEDNKKKPIKEKAVTPIKRLLRLPSNDSEEDFANKILKLDPPVQTVRKSARRGKTENDKSTNSSNSSISTPSTSTEDLNKPRRLSANSRRQKREEQDQDKTEEKSVTRRGSKLEPVTPTPERNKRAVKPKVVFTMMDNPELESLIRQLGGSVVDSVDTCTVLVTETVKRSQKLLCAVAQGKPICSPQWLQACKKSYAFLDPWDYLLLDKEAEKKWKFSLKESLNRSSKAKLLEGYTFQLIVDNAMDVLKGAIEACGGKCVTRNLHKCDTQHLVIVSSEKNKSKYNKICKQNSKIIVVEAEAIFDGTLRQEFRFHQFLLN